MTAIRTLLGDITKVQADAIVNAANCTLLGGGGVDGAIHRAAGPMLLAECRGLGGCETGKAKITPAYNLPCRYVLHTVGPIIMGPLQESDCCLLAGCYRSCLELAAANGVRSIAFCCISTGVFRFPQREAARIAVETVMDFLNRDKTVKQVIFNVFTDADRSIYQDLLE